MLSYTISEKAKGELYQAVNYYKGQVDPECAEAFAMRFRETIEFICNYPKAWTEVRPKLRRCSLKGFPYFILFKVYPSKVVVVSVLHSHSDHGYYRK